MHIFNIYLQGKKFIVLMTSMTNNSSKRGCIEFNMYLQEYGSNFLSDNGLDFFLNLN